MSTVNSADVPPRAEPRALAGKLAHSLQDRRVLIVFGALALGLGAAFNWSWLVAAGVAPLLLAALPCAAMCALGLCMSRMNGSAEGRASPTESEGAAADGSSKIGGSCCSKGAEISPR